MLNHCLVFITDYTSLTAANSLHGTLPMELSFLSNLQILRLDTNRIQSTIPGDLGSLFKLSELILSSNSLTGVVPDTFTNLGNLTKLELSNNIISGPLLDVNTIPYLETFKVDGNNFSGTIPQSFTMYLGMYASLLLF